MSLFVSNMLTLDGSELFSVCICLFGVSGEYSRSKGEVRKVMLLFSIAQYAQVKLQGQNVRFETLLEALWSLLGCFEAVLRGSGSLLEMS